MFTTNEIYTVSLDGYLEEEVAGNPGGGTETASAFIDPQFFIASPDPSAYTLEFSSGIGNSWWSSRAFDMGNDASRLHGAWLHGISPEAGRTGSSGLISLAALF
jgi:hypothetical protein